MIWWQSRTEREKWLVGLGAAIAGLFILFQLIWVPMTEAREIAERSRAVQLNEARLLSQSAGRTTIVSTQNLQAFSRDALIQSARSYGLNISRVAPNGSNSLTVWFEQARSPDVLTWLDAIQAEYVLTIDRVQIVREDAGTVSAQFTISWPD